MSLTAAASGFVVFLLSVQVIQGQDDWGVTYTSTQICAVKGSTVNIPCSYRYPSRRKGSVTTVERTLWFTKINNYEPVDLTTDSEYSRRVQYSSKNKDCTLRISDLRERDSAVYKFMFTRNQEDGRYTGSPGVTFSVTEDPGLHVNRRYSYRLECQSSCRLPNNPSYVWYKNGQEIKEQTSYYLNPVYNSDSYSCALQGYKDFPSPSVCVQGESCNRVTYTDRSICASKGSSVDISCYNSYNYHDKSTFWFSRERNHRGQNPSQPEDLSTDSQYTGRVHVETERGRSTLRISDLRERDSAEYHFKFITPRFEWSSLPGTSLTVTALQVQVIRVKVYQSSTKAELKCHSSCSPAGGLSYVWFKNREHITSVETSTYTAWFNPTGVFSCALKGHEKFPSPSVLIQGQDGWGVTYTSTPICAVKGSTVNIPCSYTYPYWWKGSDTTVERTLWFTKMNNYEPVDLTTDSEYSRRVQYSSNDKDCTLRISDLRERDSAVYKFRFTTNQQRGTYINSPGVTLSVTALQVQVIRITVYQSSTEAELKCHSSCSPAGGLSYVWFKNREHITSVETSTYTTRFNPTDVFSCGLKGHEKFPSPSVYGPKLPSVSVSPSAEIVEGSSVNLTCSSDANPAAKYTWYKENEDSTKASGQIFTITDVRPEHSGNYYCEAQNRRGRQNSTLHLIVVAGSMKSVAAGSITAIFLAIIFLCAFLFIRRKRSWKRTSEPGERPDNQAQENMGSVYDSPSAPVQRTPAEPHEDLCYASVSFSKNQEDALYSNIRLAQPHRHEEEEEDEDVEYTTVNFKSATATTESGNQEAAEELYEVYSTVSKHPRV